MSRDYFQGLRPQDDKLLTLQQRRDEVATLSSGELPDRGSAEYVVSVDVGGELWTPFKHTVVASDEDRTVGRCEEDTCCVWLHDARARAVTVRSRPQ